MAEISQTPGYAAADPPGTVYPLADYPASRQVLERRQPLAVRVSDPDADPAEVRLMQEQGVQHLLMVPMIVRDEVVGMLEPVQIHEDRAFTPTEIGLVQTLANQAAAALENARLYEGVAQANQAKSEFIDFVAHELKQPMTSMQGYARLLTMGIGGELAPMQTQFVQVITSNVDRMGKLVNDLLEISRLEAGRTTLRLEPVHLREVIDETLVNTRTEIEARHHTLEVTVPDDLPPVMGDRERLVQIMTNLVSNAYKYTPEGGIIRIAVLSAIGRDEGAVRKCRPATCWSASATPASACRRRSWTAFRKSSSAPTRPWFASSRAPAWACRSPAAWWRCTAASSSSRARSVRGPPSALPSRWRPRELLL